MDAGTGNGTFTIQGRTIHQKSELRPSAESSTPKIAHHKGEKPTNTETEWGRQKHKVAIRLGKTLANKKPQRYDDNGILMSDVEAREWRIIATAWSKGLDKDKDLKRGPTGDGEL